MFYQGRVVKFGADEILYQEGPKGIKQAIEMRKNIKKPLTREECLEYLQFIDKIRYLVCCKTDRAYESVHFHGRWYARDIENEVYLDYDNLYNEIPCNIPFEQYGTALLKRALKKEIVDRNVGSLSVKLYFPASLVFRHYILSGCPSASLHLIQEILSDLEIVRTASYAATDEEMEEHLFIHPRESEYHACIFKTAQ